MYTDQEQAFIDGYDARIKGLSEIRNPYTGPLGQQWISGWDRADTDIKQQ